MDNITELNELVYAGVKQVRDKLCIFLRNSDIKTKPGSEMRIEGRCRRDGQEFDSDNDLPYRRHKRACLCLVCGTLMHGEN